MLIADVTNARRRDEAHRSSCLDAHQQGRLVTAFAQPQLDWWSRTIGFARGLVKSGSLTWDAKWKPAEHDALWKLAVGGEKGISVFYNTYQTDALKAWTARATTDALAVALDASCEAHSTGELFEALSPSQIAAIKRTRMISDAQATEYSVKNAAKIRRWSFLTHTKIAPAELDALAHLSPEDFMVKRYGDGPESVARLRTNLTDVKPALRAWVTKAIEWLPNLISETSGHETTLMLWAACLDGGADPLVASVNAVLATDGKAQFRKERNREKMAAAYGSALVAASDPHGVLGALRTGIKDKGTLEMLERALTILDTNLGLLGIAPVSWAAMEPDAGRALLEESDAPETLLADALASADGNATLRILFAASSYLMGGMDRFGTGAWSAIASILTRLDKVADGSLAAEMTLPLWGKRTTDELFKNFFENVVYALIVSSRTSRPASKDEVIGKLRALHDASINERFRGLLKSVLGESHAEKLRRLVAACDLKKGSVTRRFVERTDDAPGASDVNRLYGSPLGVSANAWPRHEEVPMQHVITLETKALSLAAREELGDVEAVAVFVEAFDKPDGEWALVHLTRADLEKAHAPIVAPEIESVKLVLHELEMPKATFLGGKKTGPLKELRSALDNLDGVLASDTVSPRWIQEPEPNGALILELRESFASKLNFGDGGAIYVMTGGVAFQCH